VPARRLQGVSGLGKAWTHSLTGSEVSLTSSVACHRAVVATQRGASRGSPGSGRRDLDSQPDRMLTRITHVVLTLAPTHCQRGASRGSPGAGRRGLEGLVAGGCVCAIRRGSSQSPAAAVSHRAVFLLSSVARLRETGCLSPAVAGLG
jgi:hypothetical protein